MSRSRKEVEAIVSGMGVFTAIISRLVELVKEFGGSVENIYRLGTPEGRETLKEVAHIIVAYKGKKITSGFLGFLSEAVLKIDACDGSEVLTEARDVFASIDPDLKNWGADEKGGGTGVTFVRVYETKQNGNFFDLFGSLSSDVRKICLTQNQIIVFVKKYRNWLRSDGWGTFFLFESYNELFVARVYSSSCGLWNVEVRHFRDLYVWNADRRSRVIIPKRA